MENIRKQDAAYLILELVEELINQLESHEDPAFCTELQHLYDIKNRYECFVTDLQKCGPIIFEDTGKVMADYERQKMEVLKKYEKDFLDGTFKQYFRDDYY